MKTIGAIITATVILATTLSFSANVGTQTGHSESTVKKDEAAETSSTATTLRPRMNVARTADFYLRTGEFVFGRLVTEDNNKVIVERLEASKIIPSTYSKREIEPRTFQVKSIPEYKYYLDLAEYFSSRTWDFTDDPDEMKDSRQKLEQGISAVDQDIYRRLNMLADQVEANRRLIGPLRQYYYPYRGYGGPYIVP